MRVLWVLNVTNVLEDLQRIDRFLRVVSHGKKMWDKEREEEEEKKKKKKKKKKKTEKEEEGNGGLQSQLLSPSIIQ